MSVIILAFIMSFALLTFITLPATFITGTHKLIFTFVILGITALIMKQAV